MTTMGYGLDFRNRAVGSSLYWQPMRVYTETGTKGDWPSVKMPAGYLLTGTVYGTVQGSAAANALKSTMQMQQAEENARDEMREVMQDEREHI